MNWKFDINKRDDAATSVVGEILLMALVIILVSLFAASAFDLLPGDRQSVVDVSMSYDDANKTLSFWHKGGDWIAESDLTVTLTEGNSKTTLGQKSLTDFEGQTKVVFDLGGCYTVSLPDSVPTGEVSIRLTSSDSVLYAFDGVLKS
ncbi:MAG: type IV pilin N-terminal domain-containing protein [Methanocorpusculum sp.]|nr:type IV pilin N-terminal domain-containing protein [Methanocorpusculum sp.]MBR5450046.1 type IV pilin N-terminal domain-containing protein [Methanocorpusculum sp.]